MSKAERKHNNKVKSKLNKLFIYGILFTILCCSCGISKEEDTAIRQQAEGENEQEDTNESGLTESELTENEWIESGEATQTNKNLSIEELKVFMEYLNRWDNYGFLLSEYESPEYADLDQIFYSGAGIPMEDLTEEEQKIYEEEVGEIYTDIIKLTTPQINEFLQKKTGITLADMKKEFCWFYLEESDCYVSQSGDTNYTSFTCTSGKELEKNVFEIHCAADNEYVQDCVITLKAVGEDYQIISNRYEENTEDTLAVRKIMDQCFDIELESWGTVEFVSYEPNTNRNQWEDVTFALLQNGERIYEFPGVYEDNQRWDSTFKAINAVAFKDYDKDGYTDIITICEYEPFLEEDVSESIKEVRIYKGNEKNFSYMENLSMSLNAEGYNESISQIMEQIEKEELDLSGLDTEVRRQLEIYAQCRKEWLSMEWTPESGYFAVQDLDGDGILELIVWTMGGTGHYSDNFFYRINADGTGVEIISQNIEEGDSQWDLGVYNEEIQVLEDPTDGRRYYMAADYIRNGYAQSYREDGYFYIEDGIIYDVGIRNYECNYREVGELMDEFYYDAAGNEITKEQWEQLYTDFIKDKEIVDAGLKWSDMDYSEALEASEGAILRMLVETVNLK